LSENPWPGELAGCCPARHRRQRHPSPDVQSARLIPQSTARAVRNYHERSRARVHPGREPMFCGSYCRKGGWKDGADRDRTGDPLLAKQVLSQLSYRPMCAAAMKIATRGDRWYGESDYSSGSVIPPTSAPVCSIGDRTMRDAPCPSYIQLPLGVRRMRGRSWISSKRATRADAPPARPRRANSHPCTARWSHPNRPSTPPRPTHQRSSSSSSSSPATAAASVLTPCSPTFVSVSSAFSSSSSVSCSSSAACE
jgi:hypothetical protein